MNELQEAWANARSFPPGSTPGGKYIGAIRQGDNIFYFYKTPEGYVYETEKDRQIEKKRKEVRRKHYARTYVSKEYD